MGLQRGLSAVRKAKKKIDAGGDYGPRRHYTGDGETGVCRFFGNFEEDEDPILSKKHYIKRLSKKDRYQQCGENREEDERCVPCFKRDDGDKGIGWPATRANFFCFDKRKIHVFEEEVRELKKGVVLIKGKKLDEGDYRMTRYPSCRGRKCKWCNMDNKPRENGWSWWDLAITYSDQIVALAYAIRDYCKCGAYYEDEDTGERYGSINVTSYHCPKCEEEVAFDPEMGIGLALCSGCKKKLPPMEAIACEECDDPIRCDLQDFWIKWTQTGFAKSMTFQFEPLFPAKPPTDEELDEAEKNYPKWESVLAPEPLAIQAATLGCVNPFADEDDDDYGADAYGDDSEADSKIDFSRGKPNGAGGKPKPKGPKKKIKFKLRA